MKEKYNILLDLFLHLKFTDYGNKYISVENLLKFEYTLGDILKYDFRHKKNFHELILQVEKHIKKNKEDFGEEFINKISEIVDDYKEREEIKKMNLPDYISYHKDKMSFIDNGKKIISGNYSTSIYSIVVLFLDGILMPFNIPLRDINFLNILNEVFLGKTVGVKDKYSKKYLKMKVSNINIDKYHHVYFNYILIDDMGSIILTEYDAKDKPEHKKVPYAKETVKFNL